MARVVPSDVVAFIDRYFPGVVTEKAGTVQTAISMSVENATWACTIADMVDEIPSELIRDRGDYADLRAAATGIRMAIEAWHAESHKRNYTIYIPTI